jgi:acyl transferase domain-containing protein
MSNQIDARFNDVAVIGMSGRFPGAGSVDQFWENLRDAVESLSTSDMKGFGAMENSTGAEQSRRTGGRIKGVDLFDAAFFGFTRSEAEITDPQHRLFLECAWESLENAGYVPEAYAGSIGVFAGASPGWYGHRLYADQALVRSTGLMALMIGNEDHFLTTRVSYKLCLRGPSLAVHSACSTSLVAIHIACQSVLNGECDMALAGGVGLTLSVAPGDSTDQDVIFAADGHCRAFDASACGTIPGEGVAIVVLKRYKDAIRDRDHIYAVVKGSAVNNDGAAKASFVAPSVDGQKRVVTEALAVSGIPARSIGYVEAHGTATLIGDPIEVSALSEAFRMQTEDRGFCALGSVKTNIGHPDAAAGAAGFIKAVLALKYKLIPATLNFQEPNPLIDFAASPFYVNNRSQPWTAMAPRRASVNACGFGGTNAHVVLEEAPAEGNAISDDAQPQLWLLSARTPAALDAATKNLAMHLRAHPEVSLADAAFTLQRGRKAFVCRRMLVSRGREVTIAALGARRLDSASVPAIPSSMHFAFTSAVPNPGVLAELRTLDARFENRYNQCMSLRGGQAQVSAEIFAIQWALAGLLQDWGLRPQRLGSTVGVGEFVAACVAGVLSLEDAFGLATGQIAANEIGNVRFNAPTVPLCNALTGLELPPSDACDFRYWDGARERLALRTVPTDSFGNGCVNLPSSVEALWGMLGRLWLASVDIDWSAVNAGRMVRRVPLPTYPFERQRFWTYTVDSQTRVVAPESAVAREKPSAAETKLKLDAVWRELLGVREVRAHDNFFDLGGDSLIATQLISRLRNTFQVKLSLQAFFDNPTLAGVAAAIEAMRWAGGSAQPTAASHIVRSTSRVVRPDADRGL